MIRFFYWTLALIEVLILITIVLLYLITDSKTIHIAAADMLKEHNISYEKISGNLFTGIEIERLRYSNKPLLEHAKVHWNPFALVEGKINLTQLEIDGAEPPAIMEMLSAFPASEDAEESRLLFDIVINQIKLTANPFSYYDINISDFYLGSNNLEISSSLAVNNELINMTLLTDMAQLDIRGSVKKSRLLLDHVRLLEIDPKAITRFVRALRQDMRSTVPSNKTQLSSDNDRHQSLVEDIRIKQFTATMKSTTYDPMTLDQTYIVAQSVVIDPQNGFAYRADEAVISTDTSFASTTQKGYIKDSMFYGEGDLVIKKHLFERYHLPLNQKKLKRLPAKVSVNHEGVWVDINHTVPKLLKLTQSEFNVDLKNVKHHMDYRYNDHFITITSTAKGAMDYASDADIENKVEIDFNRTETEATYSGEVKINAIRNIPENIATPLLKNLTVRYTGTPEQLTVALESTKIKGTFETQGYEKAALQLYSKEPVAMYQILPFLPAELQQARGALTGKAALDLQRVSNSRIDLNIYSDLLNLQANMSLRQPYTVNYTGVVPEQSWLKRLSPHLKLKALQNLSGKVEINPNRYAIAFQNDGVGLSCNYNPVTTQFANGQLKIGEETALFEGSFSSLFSLNSSIVRFEDFAQTIGQYYDAPLPPIKGGGTIELQRQGNGTLALHLVSPALHYGNLKGDLIGTLKLNADHQIDISFKSKKMLYQDGNGTKQELYGLSTNLSLLGDEIKLNRYTVRIKGNDFISRMYARKPSLLRYKEGMLTIQKLWINDQIEAEGAFNLDTLLGKLYLRANRFDYKSKDFDISSRVSLTVVGEEPGFYISGDITLLDAKSSYELLGSHMSEDSDIIIVQEQRQKKSSALNRLKTYITIRNTLPITYLSNDINIKLVNDIAIVKDYGEKPKAVKTGGWKVKPFIGKQEQNSDIRLLGQTHIVDGYFEQDKKRFYLAGSNIYFYGDPTKPILEIRATYKKEQYDIQIFITGSVDDPIINFNSNPYLTQKEILSLILFDATTSTSGTGSSTELYAMLGGTFAKELMESLGLNVDHLLLGEGIDETLSVEVGRKISDNITVIYLHENGRDGVKLRVDHSQNFETDIILQPPNSSSIEFLYKSD